eukprot:3518270-Pyramimonas_sp.AAC.1
MMHFTEVPPRLLPERRVVLRGTLLLRSTLARITAVGRSRRDAGGAPGAVGVRAAPATESQGLLRGAPGEGPGDRRARGWSRR